jgi:hypothetical protein
MKKIVLVVVVIMALGGVILLNVWKADITQASESPQKLDLGSRAPVIVPLRENPVVMPAQAQEGLKTTQDPLDVAEESGDALDIKVLRDQMSKERDIQQQIKLRSLELERAKLQLEQEKALTEMHQLRKANQGVVRDANGEGTTVMPDIKAVFIGVGEKTAEAIININGANFTVKPGDNPQENVLVTAINAKSIVVVVNGTKELALTPNLME